MLLVFTTAGEQSQICSELAVRSVSTYPLCIQALPPVDGHPRPATVTFAVNLSACLTAQKARFETRAQGGSLQHPFPSAIGFEP
jgi:hypothetical protein